MVLDIRSLQMQGIPVFKWKLQTPVTRISPGCEQRDWEKQTGPQ